MVILNSKNLVSRIHAKTAAEVAMLAVRGIEPQLAVVLVGDDPASQTYVGIKERRAKDVGITYSNYYLPHGTSGEKLRETLVFLDSDSEVNGLILQLPLGKPLDTGSALACISSRKDVDGLNNGWAADVTPHSPDEAEGFASQPVLYPPMVQGVVSLLAEYGLEYRNKKIVVVGNGRLVGQPLATYLAGQGCDITVATEETPQITAITQQADVLICGTGQPNLITYQWVKPEAVVIDCARDVHMDSVSQVASAIAPSVGGIGPLTVAWLLNNTVRATLEAHG